MSEKINFVKAKVKHTLNKTLPKKHYCNICESKVAFWTGFGHKSDVFSQHNIVGGGYRKARCPYCNSIDRFRWMYYVLSNYTDIFKVKNDTLHFAPEKMLVKKFTDNPFCNYCSGDIQEGVAQYVVDITDICFEDNKFDYIIVNHVLEHILDEDKAISELKRCLKPNGKLILSFPICLDSKTFEDKSIVTPEGRLKAFGQTDHVRIYGYNALEHLKSYGLSVKAYSPKDYLSDADIEKFGLLKDEQLFICSKI